MDKANVTGHGTSAVTLGARLAARARRQGSLSFEEYVEAALYDAEEGFYSGGGAGRRRDFLTSPEVGPLFGAVITRALDEWWVGLGRPDPFVVVEAGAGSGTLAVSVLAARPACAPSLRYVLVERSEALRARHHDHLPIEPAPWALGPLATDDPDADARHRPGTGPLVTSLAALPALRSTGVVLANELLDNLPFRLVEKTDKGWSEVRVEVGPDDLLREVTVAAVDDLAAAAAGVAPDAPPGGRVPLQRRAQDWLTAALGLLDRGRVVVFDYADTSPSLAARPWHDWLRTYRGHQRGGHPLEEPGSQDITCEVALDQLGHVRAPTGDRAQADFLRAHGIDALVEEGREVWAERARVGDLAAVRARSRVTEAESLLDPAGLGAFRVVEWTVG